MDADSPITEINAPAKVDAEETQWQPGDEGLVISCDDCAMQHTSTCDDCMVSFILNREPGDAIVIDAEEARALRMLTRVGLVPKPRHVRRVG
jgi:Zn-finger protein